MKFEYEANSLNIPFLFFYFIFYLLKIHMNVYYMKFDRCLANIVCHKREREREY